MSWKKIWQSRSVIETDKLNSNYEELYGALKRVNGFDIIDGGLSIKSLIEQHENIQRVINGYFGESTLFSIFEVGCGSGANLILFAKEGHACGGLDYSSNLIETAKKVFVDQADIQLDIDEAINLSTDIKYDVLFSNSVFSYFPSLEYAFEVLEKMYNKSRGMIILIDIHDLEKEEAFISYRKRIIDNYEERYKNLDKLFFPKSFFEEFAKQKGMEIRFEESNVEGYWNNDFVYNCYMYK